MTETTVERLDIQASFTGGDAQTGLDKLYTTLDKISRMTDKVTKVTENSARATITSKVNFASLERVATVTAKALSKCFTATNDYVESLNLFNVAMGDATQKALEYAMTVERVMGINSGDWMNYQGSYNQIFEGYGLDPDQANQMSQQLTQLTYDLSSLWNVDTDTAFQKIQSGMSGQIKGLKVWGYNLSVASLRETALAHGIELSTAKMTEAQKAILRYVTLMDASSNAHGDLARTILTPANSLKILKSQFEIMQRTVGQVVSVFAVKLIPVVQVMIQWVTALAEKMAQAFGYELPEIDYTGISAGAGYADDLANGLDESANKAEKLKRSLLGIDEINKLSDNSSSSTATEYGGGYAPDFGMNLDGYDYDFLANVDTSKIDEIKEKFEKTLPIIKDVATAAGSVLAGIKLVAFWKNVKSYWSKFKKLKIVASFLDGFSLIKARGGNTFESLRGGLDNIRYQLSNVQKGAITAVAAIAEFSVVEESTKRLYLGTENVGYELAKIGTTAGVAAVAMYTALGPPGLAVAALVGLTAVIAGVIEAQDELQTQAINEEFYNNVGTKISMLVECVQGATDEIRITHSAIADLASQVETNDGIISNSINTLDLYLGKIGVMGSLTQDETTRMKDSFDSLVKAMNDNFKYNSEIIFTAFSNASKKAADNLGIDVAEMTTILKGFESTFQTESDRLESALQPYWDKLQAGEILTEQDQKDFQTLLQYTTELASNTGATQAELESQLSRIKEIDFESEEQAISAIQNLQSTASDLYAALDESKSASDSAIADFKQKLDTMYEYGRIDNAAYNQYLTAFNQVSQAIADGYNADKAKIDESIKSATDQIQSSLDSKISEVAEKTAPTLWQRFMNAVVHGDDAEGYNNSLKSSIKAKVEKTMQPIQDAIDGVTAEMGKRANTQYSAYVVDGLATGIDKNKATALASIKGLGKDLDKSFLESIDAHSPSKVFEKDGLYIDEGVAGGVKKNATIAIEAIRTLANDLTSSFKNTFKNGNVFNAITDVFSKSKANTVGYDFGKSLGNGISSALRNSVFPTLKGNLNIINNQATLQLRAYAQGGFPQAGEMFIANEAGPELVGTIGNKTAVANQGQIEAGIAMGVADANEEQNKLLREQNALLTKLLNKEAVVQAYVTTSDIVDGLSRKNRRDGKTTVPVGV